MTTKDDTTTKDDAKNETLKTPAKDARDDKWTEDPAKPDNGQWTSDAARHAYTSDDPYTDDTDDPHTPMRVYQEQYQNQYGEQVIREHRLPEADFTEFEQALEEKRRNAR